MIVYEIKNYVAGNTVEVVFTDDETGFTHIRKVNAVFTDGEYDQALTIERVEQVAMGVKHKIDAGAIASEPVSVSSTSTLSQTLSH